jgi:uncharacterized protein YciU (UPF0263 family)
MTPVLVDSDVILDVVQEESRWTAWSTSAIERFADEVALVINPIIYAEVSIGYRQIEEVETILPVDIYRREALPFEAGFFAGKAFLS